MRDTEATTDLLLVNATNLPSMPIYPYAFVQVSAVARRHRLSVRRFDFLGVDPSEYGQVLERLLEKFPARMLGVHLRQADTLVSKSYLPTVQNPRLGLGGAAPGTYFPAEDTRELITRLREQSSSPILVGGVGFSVQPQELFRHLGADLGIQGTPDALFARFEDVLARRDLSSVDNLLYREEGRVIQNARTVHPPSPLAEYTPEILAELVEFYRQVPPGPDAFRMDRLGPTGIQVAVEVARGCPYQCQWCVEPTAKGARELRRPLDAVVADLEFLYRQGVANFWFVCSEINIGGAEWALALAEAVIKLRERVPGEPIVWRAYFLPTLSAADRRTLKASGFSGGWNDFPSYSDVNLRKNRAPYTSKHVLQTLAASVEDAQVEDAAAEARGEQTKLRVLDVFLGNQFADAESISTSLRAIDSLGIKTHYHGARIASAERVFAERNGSDSVRVPGGEVISVDRTGVRAEVNLAFPSYLFPPALVRHFGSVRELDVFFEYIGATFLSDGYLDLYQWAKFLKGASTPRGLVELAEGQDFSEPLAFGNLADDEEVVRKVEGWMRPVTLESMEQLFAFAESGDAKAGPVVEVVLYNMLSRFRPELERLLDFLELPHQEGELELSQYKLAEHLYQRYVRTVDLLDAVAERFGNSNHGAELLLARHLLHDKSIVIDPRYGPLLFGGQGGNV